MAAVMELDPASTMEHTWIFPYTRLRCHEIIGAVASCYSHTPLRETKR